RLPSHPLCLSLPRRPPTSPLFPYTTLFRSTSSAPTSGRGKPHGERSTASSVSRGISFSRSAMRGRAFPCPLPRRRGDRARRTPRSEEHTSELQSRVDLVCRLLLEKTRQIVI